MTCGPLDRVDRRGLVLEEGWIAEDVVVSPLASDGPRTDIRTMYGDALPVV